MSTPSTTVTNELTRFVLNNRVDSGDHYTHGSMINPLCTFIVHKDDMEKFWTMYCDAIYEGKYIYGLGEKVRGGCVPVVVDFDLRVPLEKVQDTSKPLYTKEDIITVVDAYYKAFGRIIEGWNSKSNFCCVLEKPPYLQLYGDEQYYKSGFHLHFPQVLLEVKDHNHHLIPKVKSILKSAKLFQHLGIENAEDLIDTGYLKCTWLLYGSKKSESAEPYLLSYVLGEECTEISLQDAFKNYSIYSSDIDEAPIDISRNVRYYLPRILSMIPWNRKVNVLRNDLPIVMGVSNRTLIQSRQLQLRNHSLSENLKLAEKYVSILKSYRAEEYSTWIDVGYALWNISQGSDDGLRIWLKFSEQCESKFDELACVDKWAAMHDGNKTLGSIIYYAKQDNPEACRRIQMEGSEDALREGINGSHNHLARVLHSMFGDVWVCTNISKNTWYFFENHHWRLMDSAVYLRQKISEDLMKVLHARLQKCYDDIKRLPPSDNQQSLTIQDEIRKLNKTKASLGNNSFKNHIMSEAKEVFYDEHFLTKLNANKEMICMKNGVYDFKNLQFRPGKPDDYFSLQMPINYKVFNGDEPEVQEVYECFKKFFPNSELREYVLNILSEIFRGGNFRKHIYIWKGRGHNGKSVLQTMLENLLGPYAATLPTSLITGKRTQSSSAMPELSRVADGVRWTTCMEPAASESFNVGVLKELSGNDKIYARGLHQDGRDFYPQFKINVICNETPRIPDADEATWNRIRIIDFESIFSLTNVPPTIEEQFEKKIFPMDLAFTNKIPDMLQPLLWILLEQYKHNRGRYYEPEMVKRSTEYYKSKTDRYLQFITQHVEKSVGSYISHNDLYTRFRDWYIEEHGDSRHMITKFDARDQFIKRLGAVDNMDRYRHYRLKNEHTDFPAAVNSEELANEFIEQDEKIDM